ncbi:MAG: sugar phosphate nucleotidyltransferase [Candidatus Aenigmatarchaeota archaeon]
MEAILLAAGEGIRLRPYTLLTPKPLFTIKGIPLITYHIDRLNNLGIENSKIYCVVNYLKEEISGYLKRFHYGVNIIEQKDKKGTAAAAEAVKDFISEKEILIVYADTYFEDDLKEFIKYDWAIGVAEAEDVSKFGKIISENGYLKEIKEKSEKGKEKIFAGILKVKKEFFEVLDKIKPNEKSGEYYLTDAILIQNSKTPFKVYKLKGFWFDIGNEKNLKAARNRKAYI